MRERIGGQSVEEFCDRLGWAQPAPGGGAVVAVSVAMAASLVDMAAGFRVATGTWAAEVAAQAGELRCRALALADEDGRAYEAVLLAQRQPRQPAPQQRRERLTAALQHATEVPLALAELGAEIARLAARVATEGNPNLTGDAITAALTAEAATRSAAGLAKLNVTAGRLDTQLNVQANDYITAAAEAVQRCTDTDHTNPAPLATGDTER